MNKKCYAFVYSGWNQNGEQIRDHIYAEHVMVAKNNLAAQGILVKKIHKKLIAPQLNFKSEDLLLMTQQLMVLINAALPLVFCLKTLAKQFNPILRTLFNQMIITIEHGKNLSIALKDYPHLFPHYFISLIQVGEESGQLGLVLEQLASYQEKILARAQQLKKALLYPLFVFVTSVLITLALLLFIVPQFQLLFADVTTQLPMMTRLVFNLSDVLQQIKIIHGIIFIVCVMGLFFSFKNNTKVMTLIQDLIYYLPGIGQIIHENQQARYLRSLGVCLQAGLPMIQALQLATQVMQNTRLSRKITLICEQIQSGLNLNQALTHTAQFCEIIIQLVAIGEQTGQLPALLTQSAQILEQRVDKQMQQFISLLQPILVVLLGAILGCLIIALYLPVFKLGTLY